MQKAVKYFVIKNLSCFFIWIDKQNCERYNISINTNTKGVRSMTTQDKNTNITNTNEPTEKKTNKKKAIGIVAVAAVTVAAVIIAMLTACGNKQPTATADEVIGTSVQTVTQVVTDAQGNTHIEEETKVVEVKQTQPAEKSENETSADKNNNDKSNSNQSNNSNSSGNNNNQTNLNNNSGNANSSKTNTSSSSGSSQTNKPASGSSSQSKPSGGSSSSNSSQSKPSGGSGSSSSSKPAQEGKTWHEAIYEEVYHPAETTQEWVPYYIDAPIYEYHDAAICNTCGAEITDCYGEHMKEHMQKGENGSYRCETVKEIVGYEKVEVPELGHYETKVINEAYTEKRLVQEAGWY